MLSETPFEEFPSGIRCIALTGVNGFIGNRVLMEGLARLPSSVSFVGADLANTMERPTAKRLQGLPQYQFLPHEGFLESMESGELTPDIVIHNGACSTTTETDPAVFRDLNVGYSTRLWKACSGLGIPLIYASSASVYGDGSQGFDDDPQKMHSFSALNLYGKSKLDFDRYALGAAKTPPLWFGLRYFNVYGFDESHKGSQASMVFHGYQQVKAAGRIRLFKGDRAGGGRYGDGEQLRDFVYVDDVVNLTWRLAATALGDARNELLHGLAKARGEGPAALSCGAFLNVGTGNARSWNELARAVFAATGQQEVIEYVDMPPQLRLHYQSFTQAQHTQSLRLKIKHSWTSLESGALSYIHDHLGGII